MVVEVAWTQRTTALRTAVSGGFVALDPYWYKVPRMTARVTWVSWTTTKGEWPEAWRADWKLVTTEWAARGLVPNRRSTHCSTKLHLLMKRKLSAPKHHHWGQTVTDDHLDPLRRNMDLSARAKSYVRCVKAGFHIVFHGSWQYFALLQYQLEIIGKHPDKFPNTMKYRHYRDIPGTGNRNRFYSQYR